MLGFPPKTFRLGLCLSILILANCQTAVLPQPTPISQPAVQTAVWQPTPTRSPTQTPRPDHWQPIQAGLEKRLITIRADDGALRDRVQIIRIDNSLHRFEIAYKPREPLPIQGWQTELNAAVVVNGSFFTPEFVATGLTVINGEPSGQSYGPFAGMVVINDGFVQIQDLAQRPYLPNDPIDFGIQTFPVLVKSGGVVGYTEPGEPDRRSVIGLDKNGRVLIIVTQFGSFSLAEMSQWLVTSDLNIDIALNLDGGNSSSLAVIEEAGSIGLLPIPNVIAVFPR